MRLALVLALFVAGCAHGPGNALRLARDSGALLCRHCNCFMPADSDLNQICTACDCGYVGHQCIRGK